MTNKKNTKTRTLDPAAGERALSKIATTLRAMKREEITPMTMDAQAAAIAALALVDVARTPARLAALSRLHAELFAPDTIDELKLAAYATWYTHVKLRTESAGATGAKVDAATYEASGLHLSTMLKLLAYHVGDRPDVAVELADIRSGTGYQDRASDLIRAASLFDRHRDELKDDRRNYDPKAGQKAREYADAIVEALRESLGKSAAEWADLRARAFSRMTALYTEVRLAGEFVFRHAPDEAELFSPLRQVVAPRPGTRRAGQETGGDEGTPAAAGVD